ncbi:MAG: type II toxin-antitoxin system VapC family toxin [Chloroflexota bacterium]|nr:type II toxin-antitoxin system VapC family toxin [Chloroflexota bacterium]
MPTYLLDTNHASPLVTPQHPLRQRVLQRLDAGDSFTICVPVLTETLFGIGILPRAAQNRAEWAQLQPRLPCYIPDETDAAFAAELQIALRRQGRQLATIDALIAVITLRYDLILLTTDGDFRAVPRLQHENWLQPQ